MYSSTEWRTLAGWLVILCVVWATWCQIISRLNRSLMVTGPQNGREREKTIKIKSSFCLPGISVLVFHWVATGESFPISIKPPLPFPSFPFLPPSCLCHEKERQEEIDTRRNENRGKAAHSPSFLSFPFSSFFHPRLDPRFVLVAVACVCVE